MLGHKRLKRLHITAKMLGHKDTNGRTEKLVALASSRSLGYIVRVLGPTSLKPGWRRGGDVFICWCMVTGRSNGGSG
jgi:hypothetical protein